VYVVLNNYIIYIIFIMLNKLLITILLITILLIILVSHYIYFTKIHNNFEIIQINTLKKNYNKYFNEKYPIIILNHIHLDTLDLNNNMNMLVSPLTIYKHYTLKHISSKHYFYHLKDRLFIIPIKNDISVNLILPKSKIHFNKSTYKDKHLITLEKKK